VRRRTGRPLEGTDKDGIEQTLQLVRLALVKLVKGHAKLQPLTHCTVACSMTRGV